MPVPEVNNDAHIVTEPKPVELYDAHYYQNCCGRPYERNHEQLRFFGIMAGRLIRAVAPKQMLDVGCALGMLVESLRDRGVDATGIDISPFAISQVREDIKPFCAVSSILEPFPQGHYDFIICMEVVEHLSEADASQAVTNLCRHSDDILLTTSPLDFREATHFNVQPPEYWAGLFALNGFYRDLSVDVSFVMPWGMRFRRITEPVHRLVVAYERELWQRTQQLRGMQETAMLMREQAASYETVQRLLEEANGFLATKTREIEESQRIIAENENKIAAATASSDRFENELRSVYASKAWRLFIAPFRRLLSPR